MSREYCDYILDQLAPLRGASAKRMFGGFGLFRGGLMFGIIIDDVLFFKVGPATQSEYEAQASEPFRYARQAKTVALSYWNVPASVLEDDQMFIEWAEKACRTAREAQDKKPAKRKKKA